VSYYCASRLQSWPGGQQTASPDWVKRYRSGAHREPLNVRFAPKATELLRRREMSRWAGHERSSELRQRTSTRL